MIKYTITLESFIIIGFTQVLLFCQHVESVFLFINITIDHLSTFLLIIAVFYTQTFQNRNVNKI